MSSEEVFDKVKEIIVEQLGVAENAVTEEASFIDDLGADSLDIVELIMALEEEFEMEIPEIVDGIVEVKGVAREAGIRSKVAVLSLDENVDPVGACIGKKGMRISSIMEELNGEKLDIIPYSEDIPSFIVNALSPATILAIDINDEEHIATIVVPDDELSLAIGAKGQNVKLAAILTGWKIDIKTQSDIQEVILE